MIRDYRAERVGINVSQLNREMDPNLILPSAKHFESPSDPDGSRGLKKWLETYEPAPGNKNPQVPSLPAGTKKTYLTASSVAK